MSEPPRAVPLTCHGHSRPITHLTFSPLLSSSSSTTSNSNSNTTTTTTSGPTSAPTTTTTTTTTTNNAPPYLLLSTSKDLNPMLRDGPTGDWIGTFLGHKGAVWSARLGGPSEGEGTTGSGAGLAVTGSADFTARIWDTYTGECVGSVQEGHIVRAVAIGSGRGAAGNTVLATGGMERKVRVWDVRRLEQEAGAGGVEGGSEVGRGRHQGTVRGLLFSRRDGGAAGELISSGEDGVVRWWDLRAPERPVAEVKVDGPVGSCELSWDKGDGVLAVAAGKAVWFFDGARPGTLIKKLDTGRETSCVAVNVAAKRFVTGSGADTWVRVWDWETGEEIETLKGHHGPVWTTSWSPDGKLFATGSEDGTIKLWKATKDAYGLWR